MENLKCAMKSALAGLAALAVAMGIGRFAFTPLLPMMQADAGLTLSQGAWLAAANYLGYLLGALSARRIGSVRLGLLLIAVTTLAMGVQQPVPAWGLWRLLSGIASAWVLVHVSIRCLERFAGTVYAGVGIGIVAAGLLCLAFMSQALPSAQAWLLLGLVALGLTLVVWPSFESKKMAPGATPSWRFAALIACYGAFGFGYIIPATFIPAMARSILDDPASFGWAWPAFGAAAAVSTFATSPLLKRFGARRLWAAAQAVMAFGVVAPVFIRGLGGILLAAACVGGTFMVITMAGLREAARVATPAAGLMAAMTAAFAAGQIAGPLAVSMILAAGGSMNVALLAAGLVLATSACALLPRRESHDDGTPARA